jgi:hypothetical protein
MNIAKVVLVLGRKENNMKIFMYMDYIRGYLRYGHIEGEINFTEEEEKDFKTLLRKDLNNEKLTDEEADRLEGYKEDIEEHSDIVLDDWRAEDWGDYHWEELLD